jgi:hypothetical protein
VDEHELGKGADTAHHAYGDACGVQVRRVRSSAEHAPVATQGEAAADAVTTTTAEHGETGDHVITRPDDRDICTDRLDDPGGLVSEHLGQRRRVRPVDVVQVAVAQADVQRPDPHLSRPWRRHVHRLEIQPARFVEDSGERFGPITFHDRDLPSAWTDATGGSLVCGAPQVILVA